MGFQLSALFDMHGVPGGVHAFLHMDDHSYFSVVQLPAVKDIPIQLGVTHAGTGAGPSAPGTMQRLAFRVDTSTTCWRSANRNIRTKGINVIGPMDHAMCHSIYVAAPDNMTLEVACSTVPIDPRAWIDPAVVEKVGVSRRSWKPSGAGCVCGRRGLGETAAYDPAIRPIRTPCTRR